MNPLNLKRKHPKVAAPPQFCKNHPDAPAKARGLCMRCYQRMRGNPRVPEPEVEVQLVAADSLETAMRGWPATAQPPDNPHGAPRP